MSTVATDPIVEKVRDQFLQRSEVGLEKYGTTLARKDLTSDQWAEHMKQELMDSILYLEAHQQRSGLEKRLHRAIGAFEELSALYVPGSTSQIQLIIASRLNALMATVTELKLLTK